VLPPADVARRTRHTVAVPLTKWEYRVEVVQLGGRNADTTRAEVASALTALGRDGWEAVGFSPSHASSHGFSVETTQYVVLLKRPARS
jgi:hypothetical protein